MRREKNVFGVCGYVILKPVYTATRTCIPCAVPESFVRGGPTLTFFFFFFFLVDEGISGAIIGPMNAGLVAL